MYWTDQSIDPLVKQASLDGSINDLFEITGKLVEPGAIAVRLSTNQIYFAETEEDHWSIKRAESDGSGFTEYIDLDSSKSFGGAEVAGMAFLQDKLYFTDR